MSLKVLASWWRGGQAPVTPGQAKDRARTCLVCPKHAPKTAFQELRGKALRLYRLAMAEKHVMNLKLEEDNKLGVCEACKCDMELKVWVPVEVIGKDGKPDYFDELWANCWIRKEL